MATEIIPATLRDVTYIGANLRDQDWREIECQVPEGFTGGRMAAVMFETMAESFTWVARYRGSPACVFGFQAFNAATWIGWAWGTKRLPRAIPAVTRFCLGQQRRLLDLGVRRLEARTIKGHDVSQAWLASLGCKYQCDLPDFGRRGETFELWAWTTVDQPKGGKYVLQSPENPKGS